jgi:diguanylate cyclase (GGDEF)-like protein
VAPANSNVTNAAATNGFNLTSHQQSIILSHLYLWLVGMAGALVITKRASRTAPVRKGAGNPIRRLSVRDAATGLPNKTIFEERTVAAINEASEYGRRVAVLCLDIASYRAANSWMSKEQNDTLLWALGQRLKSALRDTDTVARINDDRFLVLAPNLSRPKDMEIVLRKIVDSFKQPILIHDNSHYVSANIGISIYPDDATDSTSAIEHAILAVSKSKTNGKTSYEWYGQPVLI